MDRFKKILASILCINILLSSSPVMLFAAAPAPAATSNITGVTPTGNVYNIVPESVSSNTGVRSYTNFELASGDTANLIYGADYNKFLNFVDNWVNINGTVNTTNSSGAFFNGQAVFVSPQGILVGPDGVMNVGSVSLISSTQNAYNTYKIEQSEANYNNLITNASGDVVINGRIMAADTVEAYATNITVDGNGIVTGQQFTVDNSKQVFDSIVNNSAQNASNVTVRDGKVILSASKTIADSGWGQITQDGDVETGITINNATIESGKISIKAQALMHLDEKAIFSKLYKNKAIAKVNVSGSNLVGTDVGVSAGSTFTIEPSEWDALWFKMGSSGFLDNISDKAHKVDAISNTGNYIRNLGILQDPSFLEFYGAYAKTEVNVTDSTLDSTGNINVGTKASAKLKIKDLDASAIATDLSKSIVIATGTETKSVIDIKNSTLNAGEALTTSAVSSNSISVKLVETAQTKAAFAFPFLTSSTITDTGVVIDNSTLTGKSTDISSSSTESANMNSSATAQIGQDSSFSGSGAAISLFFNKFDVKNTVDIKNGSKVTSTGGNLNIASLDVGFSLMINNAKSDKVKKSGGKEGEQPGQGKASDNILKAGGSFIFSSIERNVKVNIDNSTVKSAGALAIKSYLYDSHSNSAVTKQVKGDANFGAGVAMIISEIENNNDITINNSEVTAQSDITMDAVTELPGNKGTIKIGWEPIEVYFQIAFESGADNTFDKSKELVFHPEEIFKTEKKFKFRPEITFKGFFNNLAAAFTKGKEVVAEASLVFDNLTNKTNITVTDSTLTSETGSILANAVNSTDNADGVGFPMPSAELSKADLPKLWKIEEEGGPGGGGAVLVQRIENTSTITITSTSLTANNGNIELNAASEQLYVDFAKLASKAKDVDIIGVTHVQNLTGNVEVIVNQNSEISAQDVQISAGKANAAFAKGDPTIAGLQFDNARKVEDHVTAIDITGSYSDAAPGQADIDVEVAIGASVNYKNIDRTVGATIENAKINAASGNIDIDALSKTYLINLTMAGAFTSSEPATGNKSGSQANNNVGNWQDGANAANNPAADPNNNPVQQAVNNAVNNENDQNAGGGNADPAGGNNAANAANNAANPANRKNWSLAAAGSVDVFLDKTNVKVSVKNSNLEAKKDINAVSDYDTATVMLSGGITDSFSIGIGAAVNLNFREGEISSVINNSTLKAANNVIKAKDDILTVNIAAGIAKAETGGSGLNFDLGGSFAYNTYKPVVKAHVTGNSMLSGSLDVQATDKIYNIDVAGGIEITTTGKSGQSKFQLSSSLAGTMDYLGSDILAKVDESTIGDAETVTVHAQEDATLIDSGVAAGVSTVSSQTAVAFDGSLSIVYAASNVNALVHNSAITTAKDLTVSALNKTDVINVDGTLQFTSAESGLGANGAVNINVHKNTVNAEVKASGKDIIAGGKLTVLADSNEKLNIISGAAAIAKKSSMLSSVVSVGVINNSVSALVDGGNPAEKGNIFALNGIDVVAQDNAFILSRGGTLSGVYGGNKKSAGIAVAVNIDKIYKNVSATLKNVTIDGLFDVNVKAISTDGMGASGEGDLSNLDEILADAEKENPEGTGLNRDFSEWDMYYNLAGSVESFGTLAGAFALKIVNNNVTATVENANIAHANNLAVNAMQTSSKNLVVGSLSGTTGRAAVAAHLVRPTDSSTVKAVVDNSTVNLNTDDSKLSITATEDKIDKTILVAGAVSKTVGAGANGLFNLNKSNISAKLSNSTLSKGTLNLNADEKVNGLRIIVAGAGTQKGESLALNVALNTYEQAVDSIVENSNVTEGVSTVNVKAQNRLKTGDYLLGLGFTYQGASESVIGFRNNYTNKTNANIKNSDLNNSGNTNVNSISQMQTDNRSLAIVGGYQGASIGANIVINDNNSKTTAVVENSLVKNSGALTITTNEDEDGKVVRNKIDNKTFAFGFEFQGAQIAANLIFNNVSNSNIAAVSLITGKSVDVSDLNIRANSENDINTTSVMVGGNYMGAAINLNLIKTNVDSETFARLIANAETVTVANDINVKANDKNFVANQVGTVTGTILGGAPQANVILHYANGASRAEFFSGISGLVKAKNVNVNQNLTFGYKQVGVGITLGAGTIAGDVTLLRLGARKDLSTDYTELEKQAGIENAVNQANTVIEAADGPETAYVNTNSNVAQVQSNIEAKGDINISSDVVFKGYDGDTLKLNNVNVDLAAGGVGIGVKSFKQTTKNSAELTSSNASNIFTVKANNANVKATYTDDIDINVVDVSVDGLKVTGGSSTYKNDADTSAGVYFANIDLDGNFNVETRVDSKASSSATDVRIAVADIDVVGYEVKGNILAEAFIGDTTTINAKNVNVKSTGSTDYSGYLKIVKVSGITFGFVSTAAQNNSKFYARLRHANSDNPLNITAENLNIITGYDKLSVTAKNNAVKISGLNIMSEDAKAKLNAEFASGFGNLDGDENKNVVANINVSGKTTVETAKKLGNDVITAQARIHAVRVDIVSGINIGSTAEAENNVKSRTHLLFAPTSPGTYSLTTKDLEINANLETKTSANGSDTEAFSLVGIKSIDVNAKSNSELSFYTNGGINITDGAVLNANHIADMQADLSSFDAGILVNVDVSDLKSSMDADTVAEFNLNGSSGSMKFGKFTANFNTQRTGKLDLSASGGGAIHVGKPTAENTITGETEITIRNLNANDGKNGDFVLTSKSHSVIDSVSHSSSGGFIAVQNDGKYLTFDTMSAVYIYNSNIGTEENPIGTYAMDVRNTELVKDTASNKGGGFVFVSNEDASNTYTSSSSLYMKNTKIYATDLKLSATTDIRTDTDDFIKYTSKSGGLVSVNGIGIENKLIQNNSIIIESDTEDGSVISGTGLVQFNVAPAFDFKQEAGSGSSGFVAWPNASAKLQSDNNNTISVSKNSTVQGEVVQFFFDANGTLRTYAHVKSKDFGSKPSSYSRVNLNVNNNFNVGGNLISKAFLDIEFMSKSNIDLSQESYSEHKAFMPFTKEKGEINRNINNTLTVQNDVGTDPTLEGRPLLKSARDINITFSAGTGSTKSENHYKIVYYSWFGKTSKGSDKSNGHVKVTPKFVLNGDIEAGLGEEKKLVINSDGTVDFSKGFTEGEYIVTDGKEKSGTQLKDERLIYLNGRLLIVQESLDSLNTRLNDVVREYKEAQEAEKKVLDFMYEFSEAQWHDHIYGREADDVKGFVVGDLKKAMGSNFNQEVFDSILDQMDGYEDFKDYAAIIRSMDIPEQYKEPFIDGFKKISENVKFWNLETGYQDYNLTWFTYKVDGEYLLATTRSEKSGWEHTEQIVDYSNRLSWKISALAEEEKSLRDTKSANEELKAIILDAITEAELKSEERYALEYNPYAYVFKDMSLYTTGHVNIEGIPNDSKGSDGLGIEGDRPLQFNVARPGGLDVENYSDYSLVFGSIDLIDKGGKKYIDSVIDKFKKTDLSKLKMVDSLTSSLVINGKAREDLITTSQPEVEGITIKSLRNEENPFYSENKKNGHTKNFTGNIFIKGTITSNEKDVTIFAQSGNIVINGLNAVAGRKTTIEAPQGIVHLKGFADEDDPEGRIVLKLYASEKIIAGKGITLIGDSFELNGTITTGRTNHTFVVPPDTVEPTKDPTTGKNELIHVDGNSVDAILRDGNIYLFDMNNYQGSLTFVQPYRKNQIAFESPYGSGPINIYHGFGTISISESEQTGLLNKYPLVIGSITNVSDTYQDVAVMSGFNNSEIVMYLDRVYLNDVLITKPGIYIQGPVYANSTNDGNAQTKITSLIGGVNLNNTVINGMFVDKDGKYFRDKSDLAHNFTVIEEKSAINVNASISGSGYAFLNTDKRSDIKISDNGFIEFPFAIIWDDKKTNEDIEAQNINVQTLSFETYADNIRAKNINVDNYGYFESSDKIVVIDNLDITHVSNAPVKLYTAQSGIFNIKINESNIVETNAPVVYSTGNILVKNALGYHTFETIALSKAGEMTETTYKRIHNPFIRLNLEDKILDEETELIVNE